jgi:hypothetical protein
MTACSTEAVGDPEGFGVSRTDADQDNQRGPSSSKGKEKVGYPSESERACFPGGVQFSPFCCTTRQVLLLKVLKQRGTFGRGGSRDPDFCRADSAAPEIPAPADPTPTPGDSNVEVRQPGKIFEDQAVDSSSRGRQSGKGRLRFLLVALPPRFPEWLLMLIHLRMTKGRVMLEKTRA